MIFRFAYRRYSLAFRTPIRTAHNLWSERTGVILRLENEMGAHAFGEASPIPWFGTETTDEVVAVCRSWGEYVTHEKLEAVPRELPCLRCACESAQRELQLRAESASAPQTEVPIVSGESGATYLAVAALLPAGKAALAKLDAAAENGFRVFKWKVGLGDVAEELPLLDDLIARLPSGAKLRLDANGAWDRRRAERWLERCADRPIEFLEQPISPDTRGAEDLVLGLAGDYPTPIALDESVTLAGQIEHWLGLGWNGLFVVKPQLLANCADVLARLAKAKARVVFSSSLETAVGARHALQQAFDYPGERRAVGFGVWPLFQDSRLDGPAAAPFIRRSDVEALNPEAVWNALS